MAVLSLSLSSTAPAAIGCMNPDPVSQQVMRHEVLRTFHIFDKGKARDCRETPRIWGVEKARLSYS